MWLDLLYPRECELCGKAIVEPELDAICYPCDERMEWIGGRTCRRCGAMLPPAVEDESRCLECAGREIAFKAAVAAGRYAGRVRELVHRFKFRRRMHLGKLFASRIVRQIREAGWLESIDLLVPVPTPVLRILDRSYAAAEVLAMRLSGELDRPWKRGLAIARSARSQTDLSGAERLKNPVGAFRASPKKVRGKGILLIDDVLTTGATANECTRVLRDAGANQVWLAVIGR